MTDAPAHLIASPSALATWAIAAIATGGVILRPWGVAEFVWAGLGAVALVIFGLLAPQEAVLAIGKGTDVYLFLIGMMLLAEVARQEGLFDWLAAHAVAAAKGDGRRLFAIVYGVGTLVTIFLSNDATAVVLTPAVYAAARAAKAEPLPYLFVCAFIANAASFVLPISNPANLVLYAGHMPPLGAWLAIFGLPSLAAILVTFAVLRFALRDRIAQPLAVAPALSPLGTGGWIAAAGIAVTALALTGASAFDRDLGLPTFICGGLVAIGALVVTRSTPVPLLRGISWSVLPLVAGLFVLVEGLDRTGVTKAVADLLRAHSGTAPVATAWTAGLAAAFGSNLVNNLPMGLFAASAGHLAQSPSPVLGALLIGVDLGPNLSVTGSLATILWLIAIRRDGETVGAWTFLKLGMVTMPPALIAALGILLAFAC